MECIPAVALADFPPRLIKAAAQRWPLDVELVNNSTHQYRRMDFDRLTL